MLMSRPILALACCAFSVALAGCHDAFQPAQGAPPPPQVVETGNNDLLRVDKPGDFPLVLAEKSEARARLDVTGTVNPDIAREVPVVSLASGRVVDIEARLDDTVARGQLLLKVQSPDIAAAFDTYLKAKNDEALARKAYLRAQDLYQHGAMPLALLEQAEDAETDAQADLTAATNQLDLLGVDKDNPSSIVNVYAPISGVIIAQNVTNAAATGVTYSGSATAFTIADLSNVWILCDVYENDLSQLQLGEQAQIRLAAYPGRVLSGRVSDIGPVLDPNLRTAKVRVEVANPGMLRLGMFVTATFLGNAAQTYAVVPASAILHLHDRDWVFVPAPGGQFRRVEVAAGDSLPGGRQQIRSGIAPGQAVVANVLRLETELETQ